MVGRKLNAHIRYVENYIIYTKSIYLLFKDTIDVNDDVTSFIFCKIESLKVHNESSVKAIVEEEEEGEENQGSKSD